MAVNVVSTHATAGNYSKSEIIRWLQLTLSKNIEKIEDMHSGAEYCLLMNVMFPRCIPLRAIQMFPKTDFERRRNWNLLKNTFLNMDIDKQIPIDKITKGRFHENLNFVQWFRKFFEANYDGHKYDPDRLWKAALSASLKKKIGNFTRSIQSIAATLPPENNSLATENFGKVGKKPFVKFPIYPNQREPKSPWFVPPLKMVSRKLPSHLQTSHKTYALRNGKTVCLKLNTFSYEHMVIEDLEQINKELKELNLTLKRERDMLYCRLNEIVSTGAKDLKVVHRNSDAHSVRECDCS